MRVFSIVVIVLVGFMMSMFMGLEVVVCDCLIWFECCVNGLIGLRCVIRLGCMKF